MRNTIDLSGSWQVFLDRDDQGIKQRWYEIEHLKGRKAYTIDLPGRVRSLVMSLLPIPSMNPIGKPMRFAFPTGCNLRPDTSALPGM